MQSTLPMGKSQITLSQVYEYLDDNCLAKARSTLESILRLNPRNTEAWEVYFKICDTREELDGLYNRVTKVTAFSNADREVLLESYIYLRQCMAMDENPTSGGKDVVVFQLLDQFNYTLRKHSKESDTGKDEWFEYLPETFASVFSKYLIPLYLGLLVAGIRWVSAGNYLGYWIILGLVIAIVVHLLVVISKLENPNKH